MSAIFRDVDVPFPLAVEYVTQSEFDELDLADWLTDVEKARYVELQQKAVSKRIRQWLLGRYAAKLACRRWLKEQNLPPAEWKDIQIGNTHDGAPVLSLINGTDMLTLSIAHSGDAAVAAITSFGTTLGVDIEGQVRGTNLKKLAKRISSEDEYRSWFLKFSETQWPEQFRKLWLSKEAVAKCTNKGLQWQLDRYEIVELQQGHALVRHDEIDYIVFFENSGMALMSLALIAV